MPRIGHHFDCPKGYSGSKIVNAYIRDPKWRTIGKVCTTCLQFWPKEEARP